MTFLWTPGVKGLILKIILSLGEKVPKLVEADMIGIKSSELVEADMIGIKSSELSISSYSSPSCLGRVTKRFQKFF